MADRFERATRWIVKGGRRDVSLRDSLTRHANAHEEGGGGEKTINEYAEMGAERFEPRRRRAPLPCLA